MTFFHRIIFSLEEKETLRLQSKISIYDFCMHVKKAGKNILTNQRIKDFSIPKGTPIPDQTDHAQLRYRLTHIPRTFGSISRTSRTFWVPQVP